MSMFEDRERSFKAKYAHDEEFRFLVTARRDKLFAHEIAGQLGRDAGAAKLSALLEDCGTQARRQLLAMPIPEPHVR